MQVRAQASGCSLDSPVLKSGFLEEPPPEHRDQGREGGRGDPAIAREQGGHPKKELQKDEHPEKGEVQEKCVKEAKGSKISENQGISF